MSYLEDVLGPKMETELDKQINEAANSLKSQYGATSSAFSVVGFDQICFLLKTVVTTPLKKSTKMENVYLREIALCIPSFLFYSDSLGIFHAVCT